MSPETVLGPMPDGLPLPLYFAMLDLQDRELRELKRAANKRGRK